DWRTMAGRAIQAGKAFQAVQTSGLVKSRRVQLHGVQRGITARTATTLLFAATRMRCTVCAQEETIAVAGGGIHQSLTVLLALQDRQTVPMWLQATLEQGITVIEQVMRRDRRGNRAIGLAHIV